MITKLLIANRGEIACRIIKTARRLGIKTVAVYSTADANALHVQLADEAYCIGNPPSRESYLCADKMIATALRSGAQAIHPGYGFLSENADFSAAVSAAGLIFVGPSAESIAAMGGKSQAKALMQQAGVPLIPGYHGEDQALDTLKTQALAIGLPVLLKASAGGGGKGMRAVHQAHELEEAIAAAQREGLNSFGDSRLLIEKLLVKPRHVEVQILADKYGHCIYLFDRDCSLQRRHQKVVEEAPAPNLPASLRQAMGEAAVQAAKAIAYSNAGTIEFLVANEQFYFMEMNTRLQVEHPVTEFISGLDLVEWQLKIANGETLTLEQTQLQAQGHAIEVRLYAEDPTHDFLPVIGRLTEFDFPQQHTWQRIDTGFQAGDDISPYYDPMLAKVIAWGENRTTAIARLLQTLNDMRVTGLRHNLGYLQKVIAHPDFAACDLGTDFLIGRHTELISQDSRHQQQALLVAAAFYYQRQRQQQQSSNTNDQFSPWQQLEGWRSFGRRDSQLTLIINEESHSLSLTATARHHYQARLNDQDIDFICFTENQNWIYQDKEQRLSFKVCFDAHGLQLRHERMVWQCQFQEPYLHRANKQDAHQGYRAPMTGRITAVLVTAGQAVKQGDTLVVMEAMKMEHRITAQSDFTITEVWVATGTLVQDGQVLIE
ncbi:acetyl/propionyl/methylcrotonyl-CoA carboxylase subunit alpha [Agitococcus lubricus]|uniref:Biotin carboxylase n=1 Tax=Agitococcus lubricus TaxID=1077255 RepID=A0A2T5IWU8_9GAMM|nr:acetyl/propionyl/methylcrotonyl-CoA carboxylase subunit alpha [Agitococcus lubricus]PTQ88383.1 3-methylcrotonoyl-CoA carboxylase alpha subunit [Agitococcus lubricus]